MTESITTNSKYIYNIEIHILLYINSSLSTIVWDISVKLLEFKDNIQLAILRQQSARPVTA
jgi:hypothetical protein